MLANEVFATIIVSTLMLLLLIAGVVIILVVAHRRNSAQEVRMAQMQLEYERELRNVQFEVQEQALVNVGRELHDNIGQLLTLVHIQLEHLRYEDPQVETRLVPVSRTISDTIEEVRRLSKSLNSDMLEFQGLVSMIQLEIDRLRQVINFEVTWNFDTEPQLNKDQKVIVFRIFQEVVNNTIKHAKCTHLGITISSADKFRMVMTDDGLGFDFEQKIRSARGSGLKNMLKRAEFARLECQVDSIEGRGTTFVLQQTA